MKKNSLFPLLHKGKETKNTFPISLRIAYTVFKYSFLWSKWPVMVYNISVGVSYEWMMTFQGFDFIFYRLELLLQ